MSLVPKSGGSLAEGQKCPRSLSWSWVISFAQTKHHYELAIGYIHVLLRALIRNTYSVDTYNASLFVWYDTVDNETYLHFKLVHITY